MENIHNKIGFSKTYAFEKMEGEDFEMPVAADFVSIDEKDLSRSDMELVDAWKERTNLKLSTTEDNKIILYRGSNNPKLSPLQYLTHKMEEARRYGPVHTYALDPRDISWSYSEGSFLYEPR